MLAGRTDFVNVIRTCKAVNSAVGYLGIHHALLKSRFVYLLPLAPQQAVDFLCIADPCVLWKQPVKFADVLPDLVGGQIIGVPRYNLIVQDHCVL